jgi:hypothetical protein
VETYEPGRERDMDRGRDTGRKRDIGKGTNLGRKSDIEGFA